VKAPAAGSKARLEPGAGRRSEHHEAGRGIFRGSIQETAEGLLGYQLLDPPDPSAAGACGTARRPQRLAGRRGPRATWRAESPPGGQRVPWSTRAATLVLARRRHAGHVQPREFSRRSLAAAATRNRLLGAGFVPGQRRLQPRVGRGKLPRRAAGRSAAPAAGLRDRAALFRGRLPRPGADPQSSTTTGWPAVIRRPRPGCRSSRRDRPSWSRRCRTSGCGSRAGGRPSGR
jgi:hypothetical protein